MPHTPELIVQGALLVAIAVLAIGVCIQMRRRRLAAQHHLPPVLHSGQVPTYFYNPIDLLWFGILFGLFSLGVFLGGGDKQTLTKSGIVGTIVIDFALVLVTALLVMLLRPVSLSTWLGLRWRQWPWVLLIAPLSVGAMWLLMGIMHFAGYQQWLESLGAKPMQETVRQFQEASDPWLMGMLTVMAVIVAPVCEEVLFRGFLYPVAKRFGGRIPAMIFTALFFSAIHGQLVGLLPLFVLGLLLSDLYENTGSLWAPIAVHFCFNGSTVALQFIARAYHLPLDS